MPTIKRNSGGGFKPSASGKGRARKDAIGASLNRKGTKPQRGKHGFEDDEVLDPDVGYEEEVAESTDRTVERAEPFSDGLVSVRLRDVTVIPRIGGEECLVLGEFLKQLSSTEPFIGSISTKTSYMKKQGGRLL